MILKCTEGYWYGAIQPLRLDFESEDPVYPLAISAISAAETSYLTLYVVDDQRRTFSGATTEYANRIDADELRAIRRDYPTVGQYLGEGLFLTKRHRSFSPQEMVEDLILVPADEYRRIYYSGIPVFGGLLLLSLLGWPIRKYHHRR